MGNLPFAHIQRFQPPIIGNINNPQLLFSPFEASVRESRSPVGFIFPPPSKDPELFGPKRHQQLAQQLIQQLVRPHLSTTRPGCVRRFTRQPQRLRQSSPQRGTRTRRRCGGTGDVCPTWPGKGRLDQFRCVSRWIFSVVGVRCVCLLLGCAWGFYIEQPIGDLFLRLTGQTHTYSGRWVV